MAEYTVTRDYSSEISVNGSTELLVLTKGSTVELDDDQAAAVDRDGEGVLASAKAEKAKTAKADGITKTPAKGDTVTGDGSGTALPVVSPVDLSLSGPKIVKAVGDDKDMAQAVIDAETAQAAVDGREPRKNVVAPLTDLVAPAASTEDDSGLVKG